MGFQKETNFPNPQDVVVGSDEWKILLSAGRLFPARYDSGYFETVRSGRSPNDTQTHLFALGCKDIELSGDGTYYIVNMPDDFEFNAPGTSCYFSAPKRQNLGWLMFDLEQTDLPIEPHTFYTAEYAITLEERST